MPTSDSSPVQRWKHMSQVLQPSDSLILLFNKITPTQNRLGWRLWEEGRRPHVCAASCHLHFLGGQEESWPLTNQEQTEACKGTLCTQGDARRKSHPSEVFCSTTPGCLWSTVMRPPRAQWLRLEVPLPCPCATCSVSHLSPLRFTKTIHMWLLCVSILLMPPSLLRVSRRKVGSQGLACPLHCHFLCFQLTRVHVLGHGKHLLGDAKELRKFNWCSKK